MAYPLVAQTVAPVSLHLAIPVTPGKGGLACLRLQPADVAPQLPVWRQGHPCRLARLGGIPQPRLHSVADCC